MISIEQSHPWLKPSWVQLNNYILQNRVPQALLITGNKGLGKKHLIRHFSKKLLCSAAELNTMACGKCQSCILFDSETHPDYMLIEPEEEGQVIGISVIRTLTEKLALKPQFEGYRVIIISSAESLNESSANAFLKYLEEPTERTCLFLVTERSYKLPATIRSRCQKLEILTPDGRSLQEWWLSQGVEDSAQLLLNLAQGAPLLAKQFADSELLNKRQKCFENWKKFTSSEVNFVVLAEQWVKFERTEINMLLLWMISWVTDLTKLSYHSQAKNLVNVDLVADLQEIAIKLDLKYLYNYYDLLLSCRQKLDTQLNKQLMFEEILIEWSKLNSR